MIRTALLFALTSVVSVAVAAPVPKASEKELIARYWGKTEGRGEFELKGKQLTIRGALDPDVGLISILGGGNAGERYTAPRAGRTVTGDFQMTVKVADAALPNKGAKHTDSWPNTRAGLFITGGGYAIELHLYQFYTKANGVARDEPTRSVWVDTWFPGGGAGNSLKNAEPGKSVYLRVTRKDKVVSVSYSFDGKEWSQPYAPRQDLAFTDEVTVGVFFGHSTYQILDATFDGLTVEPLKKEK